MQKDKITHFADSLKKALLKNPIGQHYVQPEHGAYKECNSTGNNSDVQPTVTMETSSQHLLPPTPKNK